jgi:tetratricopeptide (TPR) repeat protein
LGVPVEVSMNRFSLAKPVLGCVVVLSAYANAQSSFREELDAGVRAYKELKYDEAIHHFQNATALEPEDAAAHSNLARALTAEYIPGVEEPENVRLAKTAIIEYKKVLELNPKSEDSLKGAAYLYLQMKKFQNAKSFYQRAAKLVPEDPENYYSIGVINWTQAFTPRMKLRDRLGLRPEEPLPIHYTGCWELKESNAPIVEEGIAALAKAIDLRPDYDDAMAYMNLLIESERKFNVATQRHVPPI